MPSLCNAPATEFGNEIYGGVVQASVTCLRVSAESGEFERGVLSIELIIWCKATEIYYGKNRNQPEIKIEANHLPPTMAAAVRFLEKLDISAFMPEAAEFRTKNFGRELAVFSARWSGAPEDVIQEFLKEAPPRDTKISGLPYNTPMRPDLFFNEFRARFIEDARAQLEGLVD